MEQTAVSLQAMQLMGLTSGRSAMAMTGLTGTQSSDPFLAIIENMIAQMKEGQTDGQAAAFPLPGLGKQNAQTEDNQQQALLQGFAAMLMADPTLASQLVRQMQPQADAEALPETVQTVVAALTGQTEPMVQSTQIPPESAQQAQIPQPQDLTTLPDAVRSVLPFSVQNPAAQQPQATPQITPQATPQQEQTAAAVPAEFTGVMTELRYTETATQPEAAQNQDAFLAQHQFQSAVLQAKRKLQPDPAVDLQELTAVKPQPTVQAPIATIKTEAPVQEPQVLDQIKTGITENLAKGNSEFTMKLKPESLGEITVKLIRTAGKTTLSITTASSQTAKLINNDLAALRDAVRPMQVEVHEAVHETPQTSSQMQQQFSQTSQQFSDQRRAFAWQENQQNRHGAPTADEEAFLAQVMNQPTGPNGLNIYV